MLDEIECARSAARTTSQRERFRAVAACQRGAGDLFEAMAKYAPVLDKLFEAEARVEQLTEALQAVREVPTR